MDVTMRLSEILADAAQKRLEAGGLGIVGAVITEDDEVEMFELPRDDTGPGAHVEAWEQVQRWVTESRAGAGGIAFDVLLVEPDEEASNDLYEVAVEGRDGKTIDFMVPFRRRRLRGLQFSGRIYTEPDRRYLTFD